MSSKTQVIQLTGMAETLKSMLIIPRTPSPPPLEEKDNLTVEEVRELQRRMKEVLVSHLSSPQCRSCVLTFAVQACQAMVKRERADEGRHAVSQKRARLSAGDIQLEIDDDGVRQTPTQSLPRRKQAQPVIVLSDDE
jgi:hypothetical protein